MRTRAWDEDRLARFRTATDELETATDRVSELSAQLTEAETIQRTAIKRLRSMMPRNRTKDIQQNLFPVEQPAEESNANPKGGE